MTGMVEVEMESKLASLALVARPKYKSGSKGTQT